MSGLVAGLSGCSALEFGSDDDDRGYEPEPTANLTGEVTEGFEDGTFTDTFEDTSQSAVEPVVAEGDAANGSYSLDLSTAPVDSSANSVRTLETFEGSYEYSAFVQPYNRNSGPAGELRMGLEHTSSDASLNLQLALSQDEIVPVERDTNGDRLTTDGPVIEEDLPIDEYTELNLTVTSDEIRCRVGSDTVSLTPSADWTEREVKVVLLAHTWPDGNGGYSAKFDNFTVKEL